MEIKFNALSENEGFARVTVAAFIAQLDPTVDELTEVKTVVSEAVTNAIIHGYEENPAGIITISAVIDNGLLDLVIKDEGLGIDNIDEAREPLYTTKPELERSGMGFTIMESFMDQIEVISHVGTGTSIHLTKQIIQSKSICR